MVPPLIYIRQNSLALNQGMNATMPFVDQRSLYVISINIIVRHFAMDTVYSYGTLVIKQRIIKDNDY